MRVFLKFLLCCIFASSCNIGSKKSDYSNKKVEDHLKEIEDSKFKQEIVIKNSNFKDINEEITEVNFHFINPQSRNIISSQKVIVGGVENTVEEVLLSKFNQCESILISAKTKNLNHYSLTNDSTDLLLPCSRQEPVKFIINRPDSSKKNRFVFSNMWEKFSLRKIMRSNGNDKKISVNLRLDSDFSDQDLDLAGVNVSALSFQVKSDSGKVLYEFFTKTFNEIKNPYHGVVLSIPVNVQKIYIGVDFQDNGKIKFVPPQVIAIDIDAIEKNDVSKIFDFSYLSLFDADRKVLKLIAKL